MRQIFTIILLGILTSFIEKTDCDFNLHLNIDARLLEIKDSLGATDTLILYRHWTHTNGEHGYARIYEKRNGFVFRKDLNFDNSSQLLSESDWNKVEMQNLILSSLRTTISRAKDILSPSSISASHDGLHTVQVYYKDTLIYCDELSNLEIQANENLPRSKFINELRDTTQNQGTVIRIERRPIGPKYYLDGEPIFDEDPKMNRKLKKEYNRLLKNK
ncbi:MAG: hypothetical protein WBG42_15065 [Cryomorphaceae bacterium]|jgi:hypothetical protein